MTKTTLEMVNDPKYIIVHTSEKFFNPTARVVSKRVLQKVVAEECEIYKQGKCKECFTDKQELEYGCLLAWKMTVGKGKKLY